MEIRGNRRNKHIGYLKITTYTVNKKLNCNVCEEIKHRYIQDDFSTLCVYDFCARLEIPVTDDQTHHTQHPDCPFLKKVIE